MKHLYGTLKQNRDLIGKEVICIKSFSHPNMGNLFRKGKKYEVAEVTNDNLIIVGGYKIEREFFDKYFSEK